jgi:phage terminase large subunit-like protein
MSSANVVKLRPEGHARPRIETPRHRGPSLLPDVEALADAIGLPLLPWQSHLFDHALAIDPKTGKWRHTEVAAVVSRQQGKTHALRMRVLAGLYLFGERELVGTAQDRQLARETFRGIVEVIESTPELSREVKSVRWANGQEELALKTGQRYRIVAPTPSAARGYANDFVHIDEVREQTDFDLWAAIRPTINTRRAATDHGPQVWLTSNAGHADSVLLLQVRRMALEAIEKRKPTTSAYLEWSAPEDSNVDDPKAWAQANPALGKLIDLDTIRALRASTPEPVFRTEQLCQFVDTMDAWLPAGTWEACLDETVTIPEEARGLVVFGVDRSPSWDSCTVVAAARVEDRVAVEVVKHWDAGVSEQALLDYLVGLADRWQPKAIAGEDLMLKDTLDKLEEHYRRGIHRVRGADVSRACSALYQDVTIKTLAHPGDELLDDHIRAAARKDLGDSWRLSRRHSARHIDAAMALAFAIHAEHVSEESEIYIPTRSKRSNK